MGHQPLAQQLTPWRPTGADPLGLGHCFRRTVKDGRLHAILADEPAGLHLSISFADDCNRPTRYPTWDEIAHARYQLLPHDVDFVMHLPPPGEYVAVHATCFHLHEHPERGS